jgi:hypothetical protein
MWPVLTMICKASSLGGREQGPGPSQGLWNAWMIYWGGQLLEPSTTQSNPTATAGAATPAA